jgi:hypothetical protein
MACPFVLLHVVAERSGSPTTWWCSIKDGCSWRGGRRAAGAHRILTGPGGEMALIRNGSPWSGPHRQATTHLLVRTSAADDPVPGGWLSSPASLEDLVLAYLRDPKASILPGPDLTAAAGGQAVRA